jgi:hypothetical protein
MFAIKRYVRARRPSRFLAAEVILDVGTPTRLFRSHDFGVVTFDGLPCHLLLHGSDVQEGSCGPQNKKERL